MATKSNRMTQWVRLVVQASSKARAAKLKLKAEFLWKKQELQVEEQRIKHAKKQSDFEQK